MPDWAAQSKYLAAQERKMHQTQGCWGSSKAMLSVSR